MQEEGIWIDGVWHRGYSLPELMALSFEERAS